MKTLHKIIRPLRLPISVGLRGAALWNTGLLAVLLFTGCERPATSKSTLRSGSVPPPRPVLVATPNPVPAGSGLGETTINWDTGQGSKGFVCVSVNGGPERLFMKGASGSEKAPWIGEGTTYEFRLYLGTQPTNLLSSVTVTRLSRDSARPAPRNPAPAGQAHAAR